jgi:hypothetical protein
MPPSPTIACFVTPHGFGHASRSAAVMSALSEQHHHLRFEVFTTCPQWIFKDTLLKPFGYHSLKTDIGLVQKSPFAEDAPETCRRLDQWLPFDKNHVKTLARQLESLHCRLVVCDISPLGIVVARQAGLPSVLIENFTWDWIYPAYASESSGLDRHAAYLKKCFEAATRRIQTQPYFQSVSGALRVSPIARPARTGRRAIRQRLGIADDVRMVLVSMGGIPDQFEFVNQLSDTLVDIRENPLTIRLVIPGDIPHQIAHQHIINLNTRSDFYHPDLMAAADVLIGKLGYSTLAEAYFTGIPFGYITRPAFPESAVLEQFLRRHMPCRRIDSRDYTSGRWIHTLPELLAIPRSRPELDNGVAATAAAVSEMLE